MTKQRKTLLSMAAMLFCANAVALAVMNYKPAKLAWFGSPGELPPSPDGQNSRYSFLVQLGRSGPTRNGVRAPYAAMIDNVGNRQFLQNRASCLEGDCDAGPWTISAFASADAPLSLIIEAVERTQTLCDVQVVIYTNLMIDGRNAGTFGWPVLIGTADDPGIEDMSSSYSQSPMHQRLRQGETLGQFGERTGCERISPLRP